MWWTWPTSGWDRLTSLRHPCKFQLVSRLGSVTARHLVVGVSQSLRRWTEGATYIWQGDNHVGHWPTFLVEQEMQSSLLELSLLKEAVFGIFCKLCVTVAISHRYLSVVCLKMWCKSDYAVSSFLCSVQFVALGVRCQWWRYSVL